MPRLGSEYKLIYSLVLACVADGYSRARGGCLWKRRYFRSKFLAGEALLAASTPHLLRLLLDSSTFFSGREMLQLQIR